MIAIFDEDGGGDVDFQEFVSGLSAFSSKGKKEEKLRFAFRVYDIDRDGYISNGELFIVLKMMVGSNLKDQQLQQIVDKTIMEADLDKDGKISFEEFTRMVENTDVSMSLTLSTCCIRFPPSWRHLVIWEISSTVRGAEGYVMTWTSFVLTLVPLPPNTQTSFDLGACKQKDKDTNILRHGLRVVCGMRRRAEDGWNRAVGAPGSIHVIHRGKPTCWDNG